LTTVVLASVDRAQVGLASATLNTGRQIGAAAGVAILGSLLKAAPSLVVGFRWGMIISSVIYLIGTVITLRFISKGSNLGTEVNRDGEMV
jgi:DHA2 family methylenomycin A resistance protein-like MFS transporter